MNNAIKEIKKILKPSKSIPYLNKIVVECVGNIITLTGFNTDSQIDCKEINLYNLNDCKFEVDFKDFQSLIPRGKYSLNFSTESNTLRMKSATGESEIGAIGHGHAKYAMPDSILPEEENNFIASIKITNELKILVKYIRNEPSRYTMSTIFFDGEVFSATDTKRLGFINIPGGKLLESVNLNPIFGKFENGVITVNTKYSVFESNTVKVTSKNMGGVFPDYKRAIPQHSKYFNVNKTDLINALKSILPFANKECKFSIKEKKMIITASIPEKGSKTVTVNIDDFNVNIECSFNPNFFLEGLEGFKDNNIEINYNEPNRPFLLKSNTDSFTYLLMPIVPRHN